MTTPVLVVGAGPTGLTTACELARHGIKPRIIDKAPAPSDKSKAFAVHARTLELFENIGVVDAVLEGGRPATGVSFYDGGEPVVTIDLAGKIESKYPFIQIISQADTERILLDHLSSYGIEVERGVELVELEHDDERVNATLRHTGGNDEVATCRYLVGNDGAHSMVRKQLGLAFEGATYPNQWLLADIELDWDFPYDELTIFFDSKGTTAFFPLYGNRGRLMFESPDAPIDEQQPEPTLAEVCRRCEERNVAFNAITNPTWLAWFRLHHRMVDRYSVGRVFVGGDAAHIHSPVGGQGMNMGIQDSYNLAWKLALVLHGKAKPALLDSYHVERHRVDREIVGLTDRATKMATIHNPVLNAIRKAALRVVSSFDAVRGRIAGTIAQVELHYRKSPIVYEAWNEPRFADFETASDQLEAGERVPDFPLVPTSGEDPTVLYDLLTGAEHELLLLCGAQPSERGMATLKRAVEEIAPRFGKLIEIHLVHGEDRPRGAPAVRSTHIDPELGMHSAFGAAIPSFVLIRPDGYIAFRNQPADLDALLSYLDTIFTV